MSFTLGLNFGIFSGSVTSPPTDGPESSRALTARIAAAEAHIRAESPVGDLAVGDDWITGRVEMRWAPVEGRPTVLFCGYAGPMLVALTGSFQHMTGQQTAANRTGNQSSSQSGSFVHLPNTVVLPDTPEAEGDRLAAAAAALGFKPQPVRFLAKVIRRGRLTAPGPLREYVLATPLYVESDYRPDESPDAPPRRGTVRWFSADRGWGLIAPDGEQDAAVAFDAVSDAVVGDRAALAAGHRVEFRVTRAADGIPVTAVRALDIPVSGDPRWIGRYEVLRRLGEGSMGMVYLARGDDGSLVAIKVIRPEYVQDPEFRSRFQAEADNARRVRGPHVARVIAANTGSGQLYLVSEFVDGPTLEKQVELYGPLPETKAIDTCAGVAAALETIHQVGLVHRDLTPANVILSRSGPKVIDFGIAHALDSGTRRTQPGRPIGTPAYMSPEQILQETVTPALDIFSWAWPGRVRVNRAPALRQRELARRGGMVGDRPRCPRSERDPRSTEERGRHRAAQGPGPASHRRATGGETFP